MNYAILSEGQKGFYSEDKKTFNYFVVIYDQTTRYENGVMYDDQPKYVVEFLNGNKKGMRFSVDAQLVFTEDEYVYNYTKDEEFYYWYKKCQLFKEYK